MAGARSAAARAGAGAGAGGGGGGGGGHGHGHGHGKGPKDTGFVAEMRQVAMRLHTRQQAPKEGRREESEGEKKMSEVRRPAPGARSFPLPPSPPPPPLPPPRFFPDPLPCLPSRLDEDCVNSASDAPWSLPRAPSVAAFAGRLRSLSRRVEGGVRVPGGNRGA